MSHLSHSDVVTLFQPAVHAIVPPGDIYRAGGVPTDAGALFPARIAPEECSTAEATDGAIVQVLTSAISANGANTREIFPVFVVSCGGHCF